MGADLPLKASGVVPSEVRVMSCCSCAADMVSGVRAINHTTLSKQGGVVSEPVKLCVCVCVCVGRQREATRGGGGGGGYLGK